MKVCVLISEGNSEESLLLPNTDEHHFEIVKIKKTIAGQQILDLSRKQDEYDIFMNLCNGKVNDQLAGTEVVQALHGLNMAYSGAEPMFHGITDQAKKMAAHFAGISIPNHIFAKDTADIEYAISKFKLPVVLKKFDVFGNVEPTCFPPVTTVSQMRVEATKIVEECGGVLIEEFIDGNQYAVLVIANPIEPSHPLVLEPIQLTTQTKTPELGVLIDQNFDEQLKDAAKKVFVASNGNGYALCSFIQNSENNQLVFLNIVPNCHIYSSNNESEVASFIVSVDPLGHKDFMKLIFENALEAQQIRRPLVRFAYTRDKGFWMQAARDISVGEVVLPLEAKASYLVSLKHATEKWCTMKLEWLKAYAFNWSNAVVGMWSEDPNQWQPINHSCDPNTWQEGISVVARKSIQKGDEVTMDYGTFIGAAYSKVFPCQCNAECCRKVIKPYSDAMEDWFIQRYKQHVSDYVHQLQVESKKQ